MNSSEFLSLLKDIAPALSVLIAAITILQTLERARRELASSLVYNWAHHGDWETSQAIWILTKLDETTIVAIDARKSTKVPFEVYHAVVGILSSEFGPQDMPKKPDAEGDDFLITAPHSTYIRYLWARWLNRLEGTLTAWQQGAASSSIMSTEFAPLVVGQQAELNKLEKIRGGLPVINAFCEEIKKTGKLRVRPGLGLFSWIAFWR